MLIQCTKKLLDQIKVKPATPEETAPLFCWHANIITLNRKKAVILVNDSNRYIIVLYGLIAKDFKKLDQLIMDAIKATFQAEGISDEVIEQYIQQAEDITYTKTKDRTSVARMNTSIEPTPTFAERLMNSKETIQVPLSVRLSRLIVGDGTGDYITPYKELYQDLEAFSGKQIFQTEAIQMKVTLELGELKVWRRLVVPLQITFRQFHRVLQTAFDWQNNHLYEFYVYANETGAMTKEAWNINHPAFNSEGKKPILNIVSDEEAFNDDGDMPMKLDTEVTLSMILPEYTSVKYHYDFGDSWRHQIEVESLLDTYDKNYPVCLDGEGDTPPEDVGGEPGYIMFLNIRSDENDPDHDHMMAWAKSQGYKSFDMQSVNFNLKNLR